MPEDKKEEVKEVKSSGKDVEENKVWAAIAYLGILFLIPLLAKKESPFAQFHAKQGLVLFIASIIVSVASVIPVIGWFLIAPIGGIASFVLFIMGLINALSGKMTPLPLIGKMADGIKI